jgi:hypothetical protein
MNADVHLTARILRAAAFLPWLGAALTVISGAALLLEQANRIALTAAIVFRVIAMVYGFRVALDARLFEEILDGKLTTTDLDALLGRADRPWSDRCRGARGLVIRGAAATTLQLLCIVVARWLG